MVLITMCRPETNVVERAIVLGCGPAGLMAVHGLLMAGVEDVRVFSKPRKSFMRGAQYLHEPIPRATPTHYASTEMKRWIPSEFQVKYDLVDGTADEYRRKVYGETSTVEVSVETLETDHPAWDIRVTYDALWDLYSDSIRPFDVSPYSLLHLHEKWKPDLVVSSVPAPLLCENGHGFTSESVWVTDRALGPHPEDNTVVCNAGSDVGWYRSSMIQGWGNTEWPERKKPPLSEDRLWLVDKPLKTSCDCFGDILRVGRYGKWTKGILSHTAYWDAVEAAMGRKEHNGK